MTGGLKTAVAVICCWFIAPKVSASPIVNEVLANEPERYTGLEWIELYNDSASDIPLGGYQLDVNGTIIAFPDSVVLDSGGYLIICRRLYALDGSPGFESFWGNNSGVWGDCPEEAVFAWPLEATFSLPNESGSVRLLYGEEEVSSFDWSESGLDGWSWERVAPDRSTVGQSIDFAGSTPGFLNSLTPVPKDLALDSVAVYSFDDTCRIVCSISNRGLEPVADAVLYLIVIDTTLIEMLGDSLDIIRLPVIDIGQSVTIENIYELPFSVLSMAAILSDDDRNSNNRKDFLMVGSGYRSLVLSEIMVNPTPPLECEWLELRNGADTAVNLAGWTFGDSLRTYSITDDSLTVSPGEYIVLTQSLMEFMDYYTDGSLSCFEPSGWPAFNDDGDWVRLIDPRGVTVDFYSYDHAFNDNYTWSREETDAIDSQWGRSAVIGGTPGKANDVLFEPTAAYLSVTVEPAYVSPDGDGFEDFVTITVKAPPAENYTVRIYDRQGRSVKTIYQEEALIPEQFEWNGLSDAGRRLPVGIYILYVEAAGAASLKKPIVVAR